MKKLKKFCIFFLIASFLFSASSASDDKNNVYNTKKCEKCQIDDDEYCIYNQCYFDKQYRILKDNLNLSPNQENDFDNIYLNFKQDLEIQCDKYTKYKNELITLIAQNKRHLKQEKNNVRYIKRDINEKRKDYLSDSRSVLNRKQRRIFRRYNASEKRKIKQIRKYGAIYKYPCP